MEKVRLGIIGFGNMGTGHLKNIKSGKVADMIATAVCDINPERRKVVAELYDDVKVFENATDMFASGCIDAVLIATPHYQHPALAQEAFSHGLHVLVEKPAGVYTKQVMEMNAAAEKSGKVFAIMYNQRTNPVYIKLRDMIQRGELGHIKRVNWTVTHWYRPQAYHSSATWRSTWSGEGGGTLINQNPHQIDLWQWLFGMPDKLMAVCSFGKYYDIEVEDEVTAFMQYENGTTGVYITSIAEAPGTNRLEVACDRGKVVIEDNIITFWRNVVSEREFNAKNTGPFGRPEAWKCDIPLPTDAGPQHVGIMQNYAAAILRGEKLIAPGEEGIRGLTISNAMHYSGWTNDWVDLNHFPHDAYYEKLQEKIKTSSVKKKINDSGVQDTSGTY